MSNWRLTMLLILCCLQPAGGMAEEQQFGVPREISASRTDDGLEITSSESGNAFVLLLRGRDIKPQSSSKVELAVDGKLVELIALPIDASLVGRSSSELLTIFGQWIGREWSSAGFNVSPSAEQSFARASGEPAALYEFVLSSTDGKIERRVVAATRNDNDVVALIGTTGDLNGLGELREYLRATMRTIRAPTAPEAANTASPAQGANREVSASSLFGAVVSGLVQQHHPGGQADPDMTLGDDLYVSYALTGKEHRALLNERLMTEEDSRLVDAVPVDPGNLVQAAQLALQFTQVLGASVFDGRSGHAINLERYDADSDSFVYWDPWGHGSFLAAGSNVAGITASPDPDHERLWIVKSKDLERVLYSLTMEFDEMRRLSAEMSLGAFGSQGERIEDAKKTELFTWFHLAQVGKIKDANGHSVLLFRPAGQTFRDSVELRVSIDADDRLLAEDLTLLRGFINDAEQGVFARDLAHSFIRAVVPQRDLGRLAPLVTQIWHDQPGQRGANVRLPAKPTDDYLVFLGQRQEFSRPLSRSLFMIKDAGAGGAASVVISVETAR